MKTHAHCSTTRSRSQSRYGQPERGGFDRFCRIASGKRIAIVGLLLSVVLSHSLRSQDDGLTKQERAQGWTLLFNGRNTAGWVNREKDRVSNWAAVDGALVLKTRGGGDLVYAAQQFENFELSLDWKTAGNSGVFVRMSDQKDWIMLQDHGDQVSFRNIRVRPLP